MKRKALSILLAFCLLAGELFAFLPRTVGITAEAGTGKPESPSAYDLRPTPQLTALLERIEALNGEHLRLRSAIPSLRAIQRHQVANAGGRSRFRLRLGHEGF